MKEAAGWYQLAARAGDREALYALGRAWENAADRGAEDRRARAILGWYGVSDADLKRVQAP